MKVLLGAILVNNHKKRHRLDESSRNCLGGHDKNIGRNINHKVYFGQFICKNKGGLIGNKKASLL